MHTAIADFLRYLRIGRNASELTIKSYKEDLDSLLEALDERLGGVPEAVDQINISTLRAYIAYLHDCEYARTAIARR